MKKEPDDSQQTPARPILGDADAARLLRFLPIIAVGNLLIGLPALLLSLTVAYFTFVQAEATEKIQVASVWPHVQYVTSNLDEEGAPILRLGLVNKGVGPARIEAMEVIYDGKPVSDARQLLGECCSETPEALTIGIGNVVHEIIQPGEEAVFLQLAPAGATPEEYARLSEARFHVNVKTCFCSVFDECSVMDWSLRRPARVEQCPADWKSFGTSR